MKPKFVAAIAVCLIFFPACRAIEPPSTFPEPPLPPPPETNACHASPLYMQHRAILSIKGRDLSLSSRLAFDANHGLRLLVLYAFGQVLADAAILPTGRTVILRRAKWFREAWVRDFLARDATLLFAPQLMPGGPWICKQPETNLWMRQLSQPGKMLFYQENEKHERRLRIAKDGKTLWQAESFALRTLPSLRFATPFRHRVNGENYTLELTVLSAEPLTNASAFFPATETNIKTRN